ncbi:hypothetical protein TanjilG_12671 [Lupinus angustifolius]|uniref:Auxin response factor n=1 Tax=Lupinus angustifolius TaxID=3871 RepID=A0A4P1QZ55_LUPAN|nr:PREDICTED: auxin response factor 17-like [Lupinus angustifolius]XP_019414371.1 PREDICTED: auxin response factor 17-like [Lupinus angustifolius]OIV97914.1 hypothetical protein TanjilG_12671 [Lupinus angustifolius]
MRCPPPSTPPPPPLPPSQPSPMDVKIWRACAGASVQIPVVNSRVYYFPQGHIDQASSIPEGLSRNVYSNPCILCRIVDVQFLADHNTDEVFVKLILHPINRNSDFQNYLSSSPPPPPAIAGGGDSRSVSNNSSSGDGDENAVVSFAKILTPSDANNGGGFSVPRFCADSVFPPLNFNEDPPFQTLRIIDVHGNVWEFRHIYRGTPRRHLLTTGWSKFVNFKKIVAGDSVVFVKNSKGEVFAGVRRSKRASTRSCGRGGNDTNWSAMMLAVRGTRKRDDDVEKKQEDTVVKEGFSRNGKGKLAPEEVAGAAELAAQGMPFEVVYYPSAGWSDFVVKAEIVDAAMRIMWSPGMRVKMAVETEDSSRMSWFQGTVSAVCVPENGLWQGSPWHRIQVAWDEPEVLQNAKFFSPWQLEPVSSTPTLRTAFPLTKRFRAAQGSVGLTDGKGDPFFPMTGYTNSTMGQLNQTLSSYGTFPAGMQGARHNLFSTTDYYNFFSDMDNLRLGNSFGNYTAPSLKNVSTELNIGSSQSDNLSPDSHCSLHSFGTECVGIHNCNATKPGSGSIQLFGTTIETKQPVESVLHLTGCTGNDSCNCHNEIKDMDNLEQALAYSKMLNRLDDDRHYL